MNESLELLKRRFICRWVTHILTSTVLNVFFHISVRTDLKIYATASKKTPTLTQHQWRLLHTSYTIQSHQASILNWPSEEGNALSLWYQQQTRYSKMCFIDYFQLALHVSGDSFAHLQEHFDCIYSFLDQCTYCAVCCRPVSQIGSVSPVADIIVLEMHAHTNVKLYN